MNWQEVCQDPTLQDLPYKVELNRWGQIVMSPAKNTHAILQGKIARILVQMRPEGEVFPECPIQTLDNVKVADVVWVSPTRYAHIRQEEVCSIAPEICVEVQSSSNTDAEMLEKRNLYLAAGAIEVWICNLAGQISFFDASGSLTTSRLVPNFPAQVNL